MGFFVGIDWGGGSHAVCVVDATGAVVTQFDIAHDKDGLACLCDELAKLGAAGEYPIAIERPSGLLVDVLVDTGHRVVPIHPNVIKACRSRYRASAVKDDRGDAYIIADVMRTDGHRFKALVPRSDAMRALQALVRSRDDLVASRIAMANQLRALLETYWPGAVAIFKGLDSKVAIAFVQKFPTPAAAAKLGTKRLQAFLSAHRYSGRVDAAELLDRMRRAGTTTIGNEELAVKSELASAFSRTLEALMREIASIAARIETLIETLEDGKLLMSFPATGTINAAQILVELGDDRSRFATHEQLAAEGGVAPITRASGKSTAVAFRFACNHRLRRALTQWAWNSRRGSPWAADVYARARARGCDHPHALRILGRAWLRVLWRAWFSRTPYDAARHGGATKLSPAT